MSFCRLPLHLIASAALVWLAACAPVPDVGKTAPARSVSEAAQNYCLGLRGEEKQTDGGLGGTGIYGTVTDLDQLALNGQPLYLAANTQIASVLGVSDLTALRLGEVLLVDAVPVRDGFCALDVSKFIPIVGQVEEIDVVAGALTIMNSTVTTNADTVIEGPRGVALPFAALASGTSLAVSGNWEGRQIKATHLRVLNGEAGAVASITGSVRRLSGGQLAIGNTPVQFAGPQTARGVVSVLGQLSEGVLQVDTVRADLSSALEAGQRDGAVSIRGALAAATAGNAEARAALRDAAQDRRDSLAETIADRASDLRDAAEAAGRSGGRASPASRQ